MKGLGGSGAYPRDSAYLVERFRQPACSRPPKKKSAGISPGALVSKSGDSTQREPDSFRLISPRLRSDPSIAILALSMVCLTAGTQAVIWASPSREVAKSAVVDVSRQITAKTSGGRWWRRRRLSLACRRASISRACPLPHWKGMKGSAGASANDLWTLSSGAFRVAVRAGVVRGVADSRNADRSGVALPRGAESSTAEAKRLILSWDVMGAGGSCKGELRKTGVVISSSLELSGYPDNQASKRARRVG